MQGSAETLISGGGKIYHLSIAYFLRNMSTKNYSPTAFRVTNVGNPFLRESRVRILLLLTAKFSYASMPINYRETFCAAGQSMKPLCLSVLLLMAAGSRDF